MNLNNIIQKYQKETGVPALAALILDQDKILDSGIVGIRKVNAQTPALLGDPFHIGSCTKSITSTLAEILIEQGLLTWDTSPLDIFPELEETIQSAFMDISIRMILIHEAGIQPYTSSEEFEKLPPFSGPIIEQRRRFAHHVLQQEPAVKPGSEVHYSNAGYTIAAAMIEQITQQSWEDLLEQQIFKPLKMHANFGWPAENGRDEPWGHVPNENEFDPVPPQDHFALNLIAPAGHVHMPIEEYSKFLQLHLQGMLGRDTAILKADTIEDLHGHSLKYAPGWGVEKMGGKETHRHFGSAGTFLAGGAIQPERKLAAAVFTNAGGDKAEKTCREILIALFNAYANE